MMKTLLFPLLLLILSALTVRAQDVQYQFYWGAIQVKLTRDADDGQYRGEAVASIPEIRQAVSREPRLWNGKGLESRLHFRLNDLSVASDYQQESVYDSLRARLKTWAESLDSSDVVAIRFLQLPNGEYGQISIGLQGAKPSWISPYRSRPKPTAADSVVIRWGEFTGENQRSFIRLNDFWDLMAGDPVAIGGKGDTVSIGLIGGYLMTAEDKLVGLTGQTAAMGLSLKDFRKKLESYGHLVIPGAGLYVYQMSEAGLPTGKSILGLRIVGDDDPRLALKPGDRRSFRFQWGDFSQEFYNIYGLSFDTPEGKVYADAPTEFQHSQQTAAEIVQMLRMTPQLTIDQKVCTGLRFDMSFEGERCTVYEGVTPQRFIRYVSEHLQEYGRIRIFNLRTDAHDLSRHELIIEARPLPPKPPLRG